MVEVTPINPKGMPEDQCASPKVIPDAATIIDDSKSSKVLNSVLRKIISSMSALIIEAVKI